MGYLTRNIDAELLKWKDSPRHRHGGVFVL